MGLRVTHTHQCKVCGVIHEQSSPMLSMDTTVMFRPSVPDGWTIINQESYYCDKHPVVVKAWSELQVGGATLATVAPFDREVISDLVSFNERLKEWFKKRYGLPVGEVQTRVSYTSEKLRLNLSERRTCPEGENTAVLPANMTEDELFDWCKAKVLDNLPTEEFDYLVRVWPYVEEGKELGVKYRYLRMRIYVIDNA